MFGALIIWSVLFEINKSVLANGVMQPFGKTFPVESGRDGKIISLNAKLGDFVTAGTVVLVLDTELDKLKLDSLFGQLEVAELKKLRFQSLAANIEDFPGVANVDQDLWETEKNNFDAVRESHLSEIQMLNNEIEAINFRIESAGLKVPATVGQRELLMKQYELTKSLFEKGFEGEIAYLEVALQLESFDEQIRILESNIIEENLVLQSLQAKLENTNLNFIKMARQGLYESNLEIKQVNEQIATLKVRIDQSALMAPVDGLISRFVIGSLGQYVNSGETVAEIVPQNVPLMLYARIPPEHISRVMTGQKALVTLDNMDTRNNSKLMGEIIEIDGNATVEEKGARYFEAVLKVHDVPKRYAIPGVQGSASLSLGTQTVASYFLEPILKTLEFSLGE
jgi:HlyD family type I secretion membrane fusion protein